MRRKIARLLLWFLLGKVIPVVSKNAYGRKG
jgi:hypothetical protein